MSLVTAVEVRNTKSPDHHPEPTELTRAAMTAVGSP
jgi:hypothetical protein